MSYFSSVAFIDSPHFDAFSRLRVSTGDSIFDSQLTYDLQPLLFEQITAQSGATVAHDATNRMALMTFASTPTGGKAYMQTYEHFRYTAGKSQLVLVTFIMGAGVANVVKFAGYSDGTNGLEFQLSGTTKQFAILSATTLGNAVIDQSSWNLDTLSGSGGEGNPSGISLDLTKAQILVIDFQALYVGRVRVGFDIGGQIVHCHEFVHANVSAYPYLQTANLPIRCGMTCTGTVSATMNYICSTLIKEGGVGSEGFQFAYEGSLTAANGARTHALSIQPKTTFNSITNRSKIAINSIEILPGANPVIWELCVGDVLTGTTTFNDVNATYSAAQYNTAGTTSAAPSIVIGMGYIGALVNRGSFGKEIAAKYPITLNNAGAARALGRLTLLLTGLTGTSVCRATMTWTEIR